MKKNGVPLQKLNNEDWAFINMLRSMLEGKILNREDIPMEVFNSYGDKNGVDTLMAECIRNRSGEPVASVSKKAQRAAWGFYAQFMAARNILYELDKEGIDAVLLKGASTASYYPVPENRMSADIDILVIDADKYNEAVSVVEKVGFIKEEEKDHPHHDSFKDSRGVVLELHREVTRPFGNTKMDAMLKEMFHDGSCMEKREIMGVVINTLTPETEGFYLIVHMLEHYMNSGFGINLLCDWFFFLKGTYGKINLERTADLLKRNGIKGFSDAVTALVIRFFGMDKEWAGAFEPMTEYDGDFLEALMKEVLDAGRSGNFSGSIVNPSSGSLKGLMEELGKQTAINFPGQYKYRMLRPALMAVTGARFVYNNKKVRKIKTREIVKNSRNRGTLFSQMNVFNNGGY